MKKIGACILIISYFFNILVVFSQYILAEQYLYFQDRDANGKIDTLQIEFNTSLTGTLNMDKLFLYSGSGGLSLSKLDGVSGTQIFSGSNLSGNILTLFLHEQDNTGTGLIINNTTSSHLRLKTNAGIGVKDTWGNEMKLLYTSSFSQYKNIAYSSYISPVSGEGILEEGNDNQIPPTHDQEELPDEVFNETTDEGGYDEPPEESGEAEENIETTPENDEPPEENDHEVTGEEPQDSQKPLQEEADTSSGVLSQSIFTGKILFQNPTYFTDKTETLGEYHCLSNQTDCKVNYNLQIDTGSGVLNISANKYNCEWDFGFDEYHDEKYKCNPNTITYPEGTFETHYKIYEIAHPENKFEKTIKIVNHGYISPLPVRKTVYTIVETKQQNINIAQPKIEIQSGIDSNGNCLKEDCSANFLYTEKNSLETCLWKFPGGSFSQETDKKCNPSYVKYPLGNYEVTLRVYEKGNESNYKETKIFIYNQKVEVQNPLAQVQKTDELLLQTGSIYDYSGVKIVRVFPNPSGKDDGEFIEIQNTSTGEINLKGCFLDDRIKSGSKPYLIEADEKILPNESKKYFKKRTNINLDNTKGDQANIICQEKIIDTFSWEFGVGDDVILDVSHLSFTGEVLKISKDELKEQIFSLSDTKTITQEHIEIMNKNFTQKVRKQKKGVKIYGTTLPQTKVILEIVKLKEFSFFSKAIADYGFLEVYSDEKGKYEFIISQLNLGEFEVKNYLGINQEILIPLEVSSSFDVDSDYMDYVLFDGKNDKSTSGEVSELASYITLQKLAKGIGVSGNKVVCQDMSECNINFDGRTSTGNIKSYFWDFGNGFTSSKPNPASVKFATGKYLVSLKVSDGKDEKENFFLVSVIPKVKAVKTTTSQENKKAPKTLGKTSKVDIVPEGKKSQSDLSHLSNDIFLSIVLGILFLIGGAIILRREQII